MSKIKRYPIGAGSAGGGAVNSVNGETGAVVLDADDVGAAPVADINYRRLAGSARTRQMAAAAPHAPVLMSSPPTVTIGATVTTGLDATYTADHLQWSGPLAESPTVSGTMQLRGNAVASGALSSNARAGQVAFDMTGRYLDIDLRYYTSLRYRIWVNEKPVTADLVLLPVATTNTRQYLKFDFGSVAQPEQRRIVVEFEDQSTAISVYGFRVAPSDYFGPPATPSPRVILVGDSQGRGTGPTRESFAYARSLGRLMGWGDFWSVISSAPGTGLVHANDPAVGPYIARIAYDVLPYAPDAVIIQGSVNDEPQAGLNTVGPALETYVAALRADYPDLPIIVTGLAYIGTPDSDRLSVHNELKTTAAALGLPFADTLDPLVFPGTGAIGDINNDGPADWGRQADYTHFTDQGAWVWACHVAGLLGQLLGEDAGAPAASAATTDPMSVIDAKGDLIAGTADNTAARVAVGTNNAVLIATSAAGTGVAWDLNPAPRVTALVDGASITFGSASAGALWTVTIAGDRTLLAPSGGALDGRPIVLAVTASGADRTLTLTTGTSGSYLFGSTITSLTATLSGKTDYITCIYNATLARWLVMDVKKGF